MEHLKQDSESMSAPLPKGMRGDVYESCGTLYRRAVDADGCRWYYTDGKWMLEVPYFTDYRPGSNLSDVAVIDNECGRFEAPISRAGVIRIGNRRITRRQWHH